MGQSSSSEQTRSEIMKMIQAHISLANKFMDGDVDIYSKGNSPGPVDQYTSGSGATRLEEVSNPALSQAARATEEK
jgi:hypothetical protein